jgi:hypothetical protein
VTPELEDGGWCHRRRREMTTGFGGRGRERSGGRGADVFQPEMRERDGGKGGSGMAQLQNGKGTQWCEHVALGGATEEERGGGSGGWHRPDTVGDGRRESRGSRRGRGEGLPVGRPAG